MQIVTFASLKGGTGKSTLALATALHQHKQGQKVLFIDSDPNPSATKFFQPENLQSCSLVAALNGSPAEPRKTASGIHLLSSSLHLLNLGTAPQNIIGQQIAIYKDKYDLCVVDTPPTWNNLVLSAYLAANIICITTLIDSFSHQATSWVLQKLQEINSQAAIQITINQHTPSKKTNSNTWKNREIAIFLDDENLKDYIGQVQIPKSPTMHRLIAEDGYYPKGQMATTIKQFCQELLT